MIDLRSDTLSIPTREMLESIKIEDLGDSGRLDRFGRGEDRAVNELEDYACSLLEKERAVFFSSGTLANNAAILTHCKPEDKVLVDKIQHIYKTEKAVFSSKFGQLQPVFYNLDENGTPCLESLEKNLQGGNIKLLILENSHNFAGGTCIGLEKLREIHKLSKKHSVLIHMDGARIFNAAFSLKVDLREIVKYVDSVMFCLSKGLGAPMGSLLLGNSAFIGEVLEVKKILGGNMRQAGVIAAPGLYALKNNIGKLKMDNENAKYFGNMVKSNGKIRVQGNIETNIVMLDIEKTKLSTEEFCERAKEKGLYIRPVLENKVRLVFYSDISREDTIRAGEIILNLESEL